MSAATEVPAGCCSVPPAGYGTAEWDRDRQPLVDAFTRQHARALAIQAGTDRPFTEEARRIHGLRDGQAFPPRWLDDPTTRADAYHWRECDEAELRALGFCRHCGQRVALMQVGRCVYTTCDHYRAHGDASRMQAYLNELRGRITPDRAAALLAMIGTMRTPAGAA